MNFRKIIIAALKAATVKDEILYVFKTFGLETSKDKSDLLQEAMGGTWFDLPQDDNAKCEMLQTVFLEGAWRHADKLSALKEIVNTL